MTTLTIPLTTLPVGAHVFGPASVADAESAILFTIDRTPAGGLNSLTAASTLAITADQSDDGGTTWREVAGASWDGGIFLDRHGAQVNSCTLATSLFPGTSRKLRGTVTTGGTPIAVSGSVVTS